MSLEHPKLNQAPRLLMEAELRPVQGERFQPTGFADLGSARYTLHDGTEMLLVDSAQSVANRMEVVCWDEKAKDFIEGLRGLPCIQVVHPEFPHLTNSVLEAHRINSEYIMNTNFKEKFSSEIGCHKDMPVDWEKFRNALLKYDPCSIIHGTFLEEIDGRLRVTRALSGFIEASDVRLAESGGVKINIVEPGQAGGEGNVPYHRSEFTARRILAFFNLDLALLRGYGLQECATRLLVALSLFKVRRFLSSGLRLRTACDLRVAGDLKVTSPEGFTIPSESHLLDECKELIAICQKEGLFALPSVTKVDWKKPEKKGKKKGEDAEPEKSEEQDEETD